MAPADSPFDYLFNARKQTVRRLEQLSEGGVVSAREVGKVLYESEEGKTVADSNPSEQREQPESLGEGA